MAATKGKAPTKGKKEILEGNKATLSFYTKIMVVSTALYIIVCFLLRYQSSGWFTCLATAFASGIFVSCYIAMTSMAQPTYSDSGGLIDGGIDLNMTSGLAEHLKDLILLTAIVQVLSVFSNYIWIFWLLAPSRVFYMLWTYILAPWIFAAPPEQDLDPKAQKKMERKMKRGGMM